jgi:hypothetical protein
MIPSGSVWHLGLDMVPTLDCRHVYMMLRRVTSGCDESSEGSGGASRPEHSGVGNAVPYRDVV